LPLAQFNAHKHFDGFSLPVPLGYNLLIACNAKVTNALKYASQGIIIKFIYSAAAVCFYFLFTRYAVVSALSEEK